MLTAGHTFDHMESTKVEYYCESIASEFAFLTQVRKCDLVFESVRFRSELIMHEMAVLRKMLYFGKVLLVIFIRVQFSEFVMDI